MSIASIASSTDSGSNARSVTLGRPQCGSCLLEKLFGLSQSLIVAHTRLLASAETPGKRKTVQAGSISKWAPKAFGEALAMDAHVNEPNSRRLGP